MSRSWVACALMSFVPALASAQAPMSPLEISIACAPAPRLAATAGAGPRIAGSQDVVDRTVFGGADLLVVAAGTQNGLAIGQRYFVRRAPASRSKYVMSGHVTPTSGWVHIVAIDDKTAIAAIDHACTPIQVGDYLEPFAAPEVPAALTTDAKLGELDFSSPAKVLFGDDERNAAAIGEYVLVDRGTSSGVTRGSRFAVYRDMAVPNVPLTSVGEAVVIAESPDAAVLRIVRARDAVYAGDYLVPEKK